MLLLLPLLLLKSDVQAQIIYYPVGPQFDGSNLYYMVLARAMINHSHDAGAITSGTLNVTFYDAYSNLVWRGDIGTNAGQVAHGDHIHDLNDTIGTLSSSRYRAYDSLVLFADIGTNSTQVAVGNHIHADYADMIVALQLRASVWDTVTNKADISLLSEGTYPVFQIPLGGAWTDFEIKASTNNFASLVYYYKSWTTQDATRGDTNAAVYFTDDYADDVRVWRGKQKNEPISAHLLSEDSEVEYAYFYPSHDCEVAWSDWMFKTNASLVWSYVRVDDASFEMRADGAAQHWSPIQPHSWEKSMLKDVSIVALVPSPLPSTVTNDIFVSGSIYLGNDITAPSIRGLGITNILHKAGTNEAIFGFPW